MRKNRRHIRWQLVWLAISGLGAGASAHADTIAIPARNLSSKSENIRPIDKRWDGLVVCYGKQGMQQWRVDFETPGPHYLHFQYASGERRPLGLFINDAKTRGAVLKRNTGGFFVRDLAWGTYGPYELQKGKNTLPARPSF